MMNDIQRRILAEAIKYGGGNISVPEQMAKAINESPVLTGGEAAPTLFGWGKHQFEAKFRELLTRMGFERGIIHMKTEGQEMKMYFANAAKARDFVVAFNGLARRKSMGSVASVATQFNKIKAPTGTNAIVSLDLTMIRGESLDIEGTDLYEWFTGDSITEEPLNEGGVKAALADFMYDLPKAAIAEIKPLMTSKRGPADEAMRIASIRAILKKHKIKKNFMGFDTANLVDFYFNTFHGESVEVEGEEPINEVNYSKAKDTSQFIPSRYNYVLFFKTLKEKKIPFDQAKAEASLEYVFEQSFNPKSQYHRYIKDVGDLIREAMTHYMKATQVGGVIEQLSEQQQVIGKYRFTSFTEGSISGWMVSVQGIGEVGFIKAPAKKNTKVSIAPHQLYKTKGQSEGSNPELVMAAFPDKTTRFVNDKEIRFAPRQLLKAVAMWMDKHGKVMTEETQFVEDSEIEVSEQFRAGDKVKVPHKGKMVSGKIVRFDDGGTSKAQQHGGGYVVDVGEPASILVPKQKVQKEETMSEYRRYGYRSTSYSGDPRWITAKYAGRDANGKPFKAGERVLYFPNGKKFYTGAEAEKAWLEFLSAKGDEEGMPFAR